MIEIAAVLIEIVGMTVNPFAHQTIEEIVGAEMIVEVMITENAEDMIIDLIEIAKALHTINRTEDPIEGLTM